MLLSIIDRTESQISSCSNDIEIRLHLDESGVNEPAEGFTADYFSSPVSDNFRKSLRWYFSDYVQDIRADKNDDNLIVRLIKAGEEMGDNFLGQDHELIKVKEMIEDRGFEHLDVVIESNHPEFFQELWEICILPESGYVLSTVAKSFSRQFINEQKKNSDKDLRLGLSAESPLKILHLVSRPAGDTLPSNVFSAYVDSLEFDGAIDYGVFPVNGWSDLKREAAFNDAHIVHYDGPVRMIDNQPYLFMNNNADDISDASPDLISLNALFESINPHARATLVLEATAWLQRSDDADHAAVNDEAIDDGLGLALFARHAINCGFGNVLGLSHLSDPWTNRTCFKTFYQQLTKGLDTGQAIVETRKFLQAQTQSSTFTAKPAPFQYWSLPVHYGTQKVSYFDSAQPGRELTECTCYSDCRNRLHGFNSAFLPPSLQTGGDTDFVRALSCCRQSNAIYISGNPGGGKTRLCHQLAFYLCGDDCRYGFYFDFKEHRYSLEDILEMISPILLNNDPENIKHDGAREGQINRLDIKQALADNKSLFVFDNIPETSEPSTVQFFATLPEQSYRLILSGNEAGYINVTRKVSGLSCVDLEPLSLLQQKYLAATVARQYRPEADNQDYSALLQALDGNPFLTIKAVAALSQDNEAQIVEAMRQINADNKNVVNAFYDWQWSQMDALWRSWLLLLPDLQNVLLEMIGLVCDNKTAYQPARDLFALLSDNRSVDSAECKFSEGMDVMDRAGFLLSVAHGRIIDPRCLGFLTAKRERESRPDQKTEQINIKVSQLLCESFSRLIPVLQRDPNPGLTYNLMMNRGLWVRHFERLWFARQYQDLQAAYLQLGHMMQQHRLYDEMAMWSLDLLNRTDDFADVDALLDENQQREIQNYEKTTLYLVVATGALKCKEPTLSDSINEAAGNWRRWLDRLPTERVKDVSGIFYHCVTFLEMVYQHQQNPSEQCRLSEIAYNAYKTHRVWQRALPHLFTLIERAGSLNENSASAGYEQQLFNDVPYDSLPEGTKAQAYLQLAAIKAARSDMPDAQQLLDELKNMDGAERFTGMIKAVQADIDQSKPQTREASV